MAPCCSEISCGDDAVYSTNAVAFMGNVLVGNEIPARERDRIAMGIGCGSERASERMALRLTCLRANPRHTIRACV